jgi:hypothetical protein
LSTSAIHEQHVARRKLGKTAVVYLAAAAGSVLFDRIYAIFGHGVFSAGMSLLFLYPLLAGAVPFAILWFFTPQMAQVRHFRLFSNGYHSGLAAIMAGSLLQGVYEIAGTRSPGTTVLMVGGLIMLLSSLACFLYNLYRLRRAKE